MKVSAAAVAMFFIDHVGRYVLAHQEGERETEEGVGSIQFFSNPYARNA